MAELIEIILRRNAERYPSEELDECSYSDEKRIKSMIREDLPKLKITRIERVDNTFLKAMYKLKKQEYISRYGSVEEMLLFHATDEDHVESIIKDNFDWRRVTRNKFGIGTSFSDDADYANCHSNRKNGTDRAFIVTKVLVENTIEGDYGQEIPEKGYDTTVGNDKVFVKFNDNEFLPKFVVFYECPQLYRSKYYNL